MTLVLGDHSTQFPAVQYVRSFEKAVKKEVNIQSMQGITASRAGVDVGVGPVLDEPSGDLKHAVDGLAGLFFRRQFALELMGLNV